MATNYDAVIAAEKTGFSSLYPAGLPAPSLAGIKDWLDGWTYIMDLTIDHNAKDTGSVFVNMIPSSANEFIAIAGMALGTGTNSLRFDRVKSESGGTTGRINNWAFLAAAANANVAFPQSSAFASAASSSVDTTDLWTRLISGSHALQFTQGNVGANTDTVEIFVVIRLLNRSVVPTVTLYGGVNLATYKITGASFSNLATGRGVSTDAFLPA